MLIHNPEPHDCVGRLCRDLVKEGTIGKRLKNTTKTRNNNSKNQERNLSKRYQDVGFEKARRVPGSGSISILPGDVDPGEWFMGEAKMTRTGKLTIQPTWIRKIAEQAKQMGRPWWVLHTWTAEGLDQFTKCVTLSEDTFYELLRRLKAAEAELGDQHD